MCGTCGCGQPDESAAHAHAHAHGHGETETRRVTVERALLQENDLRAETLRKRLAERGLHAVGLLGGPGAGKTALLEATLGRLGERAGRQAVVEGDCATDRDARRVAAAGARVAQVNTGSVCHLDAHMVEHALEKLDLSGCERVFVENVGNLVCPAPFACGETRRAVLVSVPEGDDKPEKYPALLAAADLLVVTKTDLLPHVDFDVARCVAGARRAHPGLPWLALSAKTGEGMDGWMDWLEEGP